MTDDDELRYCICADPENCTEKIPGKICRHSTGMTDAKAWAVRFMYGVIVASIVGFALVMWARFA